MYQRQNQCLCIGGKINVSYCMSIKMRLHITITYHTFPNQEVHYCIPLGRKTRQPPSAAHKAAAPQSSFERGAAASRNAYGAVGWCNVVPEDRFTAIYRNASFFPLCCFPFSSPEPPYAVSRCRAARGILLPSGLYSNIELAEMRKRLLTPRVSCFAIYRVTLISFHQ